MIPVEKHGTDSYKTALMDNNDGNGDVQNNGVCTTKVS